MNIIDTKILFFILKDDGLFIGLFFKLIFFKPTIQRKEENSIATAISCYKIDLTPHHADRKGSNRWKIGFNLVNIPQEGENTIEKKKERSNGA